MPSTSPNFAMVPYMGREAHRVIALTSRTRDAPHTMSNIRMALCRYFDRVLGALGAAGGAVGAGFAVALEAPSQSQASASRERTGETLPRLNSASCGASWWS